MSIGDTFNSIYDADRDLNLAISNGAGTNYSEAGIRLCAERAYQPMSDSIGAITVHVTVSSEALELAKTAMGEVENVRSLGSLSLPALMDAKDRAAAAEQKFSDATKLVETVLESSRRVPDSLNPTPAHLSEYVKDSGTILEFMGRKKASIEDAKAHIQVALGDQGDHPLVTKVDHLDERASQMIEVASAAKEHIVGAEDSAPNGDPQLLHALIGNMRASLTLLESALGKPLDQFTTLLIDATNKIGPEDLKYFKELTERLKSGIDTHATATEIKEEIRLSIFDMQKDIKELRHTL